MTLQLNVDSPVRGFLDGTTNASKVAPGHVSLLSPRCLTSTARFVLFKGKMASTPSAPFTGKEYISRFSNSLVECAPVMVKVSLSPALSSMRAGFRMRPPSSSFGICGMSLVTVIRYMVVLFKRSIYTIRTVKTSINLINRVCVRTWWQ